jgi:ferredoxin
MADRGKKESAGMSWESFIEGPLLWVVFCLLAIGCITRFVFFLVATVRKNRQITGINNLGNVFLSTGRLFIPFYKAFTKKPVYSLFRYLFHICLIATPIWLAGHISLWESSFGWSYSALPYATADAMTLFVIAAFAFFFGRRIFFRGIRKKSALGDYLFPIFCMLPFLSGYLMAHGTLDANAFFRDNLLSIHILTSCAMIVAVVFLFIPVRLDKSACIGCGACESNCLGKTITSAVIGANRVFTYSHYQCISCGTCVAVCQENAAELRHELSFKKFFGVFQKQEIGSVALSECRNCGVRFAPEPQVAKLEAVIGQNLHLCPQCRMLLLIG